MASFLALKRGTAAATSFRKLFSPIRSVSATPSFQRCFNTDRRSDSDVSRGRGNDFSYLIAPRSLIQIFKVMYHFVFTKNLIIFVTPGGGIGVWDTKVVDNALNLRLDMPGLDKENVKISVEQNTLIIKTEAGDSLIKLLPTDALKLEEIKAEMKNGVLEIVLPRVNR